MFRGSIQTAIRAKSRVAPSASRSWRPVAAFFGATAAGAGVSALRCHDSTTDTSPLALAASLAVGGAVGYMLGQPKHHHGVLHPKSLVVLT